MVRAGAELSRSFEFIKLTPEISTESTRLPGKFHRDPADQIIADTPRILDVHL